MSLSLSPHRTLPHTTMLCRSSTPLTLTILRISNSHRRNSSKPSSKVRASTRSIAGARRPSIVLPTTPISPFSIPEMVTPFFTFLTAATACSYATWMPPTAGSAPHDQISVHSFRAQPNHARSANSFRIPTPTDTCPRTRSLPPPLPLRAIPHFHAPTPSFNATRGTIPSPTSNTTFGIFCPLPSFTTQSRIGSGTPKPDTSHRPFPQRRLLQRSRIVHTQANLPPPPGARPLPTGPRLLPTTSAPPNAIPSLSLPEPYPFVPRAPWMMEGDARTGDEADADWRTAMEVLFPPTVAPLPAWRQAQ